MRIAREGYPFIVFAIIVEILLYGIGLYPAAMVWALILIWVIAFFRDPERQGPRGDQLIIAPADGRIVSIIPIHEPDVIKGQAMRISIFMNVFNVHVNRYPVNGEVIFRRYRKGRFFNAADEKAALENEQSDIGQQSPSGPILSRQIAGLVARRIITDHEPGHQGIQGSRLGLIRFGSRVDVFVPPGVNIKVREGETTKAGVTVLAEWN